ncbi:hypothetical protein EAH74_26295 [Pseudomonas mandelii]|uniref:Uncharacterized protein n=1 Tax=Pseudomonas mandelii TaxID=75612 RepID=A0A502HXH4_9PSED|nr:hypothetical protein EAH74_26295 [Pseudomonas mandelii]
MFQSSVCRRSGPFASRLAPTGECIPNVGASLLAKAIYQTLQILKLNPVFPAPALPQLQQPYPWSSTH